MLLLPSITTLYTTLTTSISSTVIPALPTFVMNTWIAPHGATDLIHAIHHNTTALLATTYYGTIGLGQLCHAVHQDQFFYSLFMMASFIHFYDDWKCLKNPLLATILTGSLLSTFVQTSWLPFYLYMTFHHVPNHYMQMWPTLRKHKIPTVLLLAYTGFSFCFFTNEVGTNMVSIIDDLGIWIASIVIGHIAYNVAFSVQNSGTNNNNQYDPYDIPSTF
jgi:hypothetical protein